MRHSRRWRKCRPSSTSSREPGAGVVAVWRVKPARVVYGHFYFFMSEALLRTESGGGSGSVHNRRFPLLDSPAA
jgi:hypothetical protein